MFYAIYFNFNSVVFEKCFIWSNFKTQRKRNPGAFCKRTGPKGSDLVHQVIETNSWIPKHTCIISFYEIPILVVTRESESTDSVITKANIGYVLVSTNKSGSYQRILIDSILSNGGDPKIQSVFFCHADSSVDKELAILVSWEQRHHDVNGQLYGTYFYKRSDGKDNLGRFYNLDKISEKFYGCECSNNDGTSTVAKFKTAEEVKEELTRLGFKQ